MADTITRTYWIVPGDNNPKGEPKEYPTREAAMSVPALGVNLPGRGAPVEVKEEMSADGEVTISHRDPQTDKFVEVGRVVDQGRLDLYKARQATAGKSPTDVAHTQAETDEAKARTALIQAQAAQQGKKTPEEIAQTQAQTDEAKARTAQLQAQTAGLNPQIQVPTGRYERSEGQTTPETRSVGAAQATYDLQQAQLANTAAQQARENIIAQARLDVEKGNLSATEAHNRAIEEIQKLQLQLDEQRNKLTQRGQDVSAGVAQRGQDLDYSRGLAQAGTSFAARLMQDVVTPEQIAQTNAIGAQMGLPAVQARPAPWGPDLPLQLARQAQAQAPAPFQLPQGPFKTPPAA